MLGLGTLMYFGFLKRSGSYQANRFFLLLWPILSVVMAAIHIKILGAPIIMDALVVTGSSTFPDVYFTYGDEKPTVSDSGFFTKSWLEYLFLLGMTLRFLWMLVRLGLLAKLILIHPSIRHGRIWVVKDAEGVSPASFGPVLFWKSDWEIEGPIFEHEKIHMRQYHSLDRILFELILIVLWFNPLMYILRRELHDQHEFIADASFVKNYSVYTYAQLLLQNQQNPASYQWVAPFSNHLKKRLKMLNHPTVNAKWRYLLVLPLFLVCCAFFPFETYHEVHWLDTEPLISEQLAAETTLQPTTNLTVRNGQLNFIWPISPIKYDYSSGFGMRVHPITKKQQFHYGVDVKAPIGTPVLASATGKVITSKYGDGYGHYIVVEHNNQYQTKYCHLDERLVAIGDMVEQSSILGTVGNSGKSIRPHLHFEMRKDGKPINPETFLPKFK